MHFDNIQYLFNLLKYLIKKTYLKGGKVNIY